MIAARTNEVVDKVKTTLQKRAPLISFLTMTMALIYFLVTLLVIQQRGCYNFYMFRRVLNEETMTLNLWAARREYVFKSKYTNWGLVEASCTMALFGLTLQILSSVIVLSEKWVLWYVVTLSSLFFNILSFIFPFCFIKHEKVRFGSWSTGKKYPSADYFHDMYLPGFITASDYWYKAMRYYTACTYLGVSLLNLLFLICLLLTLYTIQVLWPKYKKKGTGETIGNIKEYGWTFWKTELRSIENYLALASFGYMIIHFIMIIIVFVGLGDGMNDESFLGRRIKDSEAWVKMKDESKSKYIKQLLNQGLLLFSLSLSFGGYVTQVVSLPLGVILKKWRGWRIVHYVLAGVYFAAFVFPLLCTSSQMSKCSKKKCCSFFHSVDVEKWRIKDAINDERLTSHDIYTRQKHPKIMLYEISIAYLFFTLTNSLVCLCLALYSSYKEKINSWLKKNKK